MLSKKNPSKWKRLYLHRSSDRKHPPRGCSEATSCTSPPHLRGPASRRGRPRPITRGHSGEVTFPSSSPRRAVGRLPAPLGPPSRALTYSARRPRGLARDGRPHQRVCASRASARPHRSLPLRRARGPLSPPSRAYAAEPRGCAVYRDSRPRSRSQAEARAPPTSGGPSRGGRDRAPIGPAGHVTRAPQPAGGSGREGRAARAATRASAGRGVGARASRGHPHAVAGMPLAGAAPRAGPGARSAQ